MKTLLLLCFLMVSTAFAQNDNTFRLICRGGYNYSQADHIDGFPSINFTKAPKAAGEDGASLQPGQCAWVDRPVSATEPSKISFYYFSNEMYCRPHLDGYMCNSGVANSKQSFAIMFQNCALNKDCILSAYVYTRSGSFQLSDINPRASMQLK